MAELPDLQAVPAGTLVLHMPQRLSAEQHAMLQAAFAKDMPGRAVLILDGGARLAALDDLNSLQRIEAKLDALLAALADEADEDVRPGLTLDGDDAGAPRDEGRPL